MELNYATVETITIIDFIRLSLSEQCKILKQLGIFLESYQDKETLVKIYYVSGFFVEVTISKPELEKIEIIPYRNGYKSSHYGSCLFKKYTPVWELRKVA